MHDSSSLRRRARYARLILIGVGLLAAAFYFWTVTSNAPAVRFTGRQTDYYNLLAQGMRAGHLHLNAEPDPALIAMPIAQRPGNAPYLLDASLYGSHYYLYFGPTPAVTIFLPYLWLTGHDLHVSMAVALLATAGCWLGLAWLGVMRRRFFPDAGPGTLLVAALAVGFATAVPVAIRKPEVYEAAICAGYAWGMSFLMATTLAILRPEARARWLAWASLSAGFAAGSRVNLLFGATALGGVVAWWFFQKRHAARDRWRWVLAAVAPAAVIGLLLAVYNYLRFDDPLEFGHRYQVGSIAENFVSLRYFLHNLTVYYLTPPATGWFFPFFAPGGEGARPAGYMGIEHLHGQWLFLGWLVALPVAGWAAWKRGRLTEPLALVAGAVAWWFVANFAMVASISARTNRYMLDFHPALVLLAGMTLLAWGHIGAPRRWVRRAGAVALAAAVVFNVMVSFQVHQFFQKINPEGYATLQRAFNRAAWPLHRLTQPAFGALALEVVFPNATPGTIEPLISTGTPLFTNTVSVEYLAAGSARIRFDHESEGGPSGPTFTYAPERAHVLTVTMGSLLPPAQHPWFDGVAPDEVQRRKQEVRVELDGRVVFASNGLFHDASPGQVRVGKRKVTYRDERPEFTGRLVTVKRAPPAPPAAAARVAEPLRPPRYRLDVTLPRDRFGVIEPLFATGQRRRGDAILVKYTDPRTIRLAHDQIGGGIEWSEPLTVDYVSTHRLEVALVAEAGADVFGERAGSGLRPVVRWDGRVALVGKTPFHPFSRKQAAVAFNSVWSSPARMYFGGMVGALVTAEEGATTALAGPGGWSRATGNFEWPAGLPTDREEPLLIFKNREGLRGALVRRGAAGGGIEFGWLDAAGAIWSPPQRQKAAVTTKVELAWREPRRVAAEAPAAVLALDDFLRGRVEICVDGVPVWQPVTGFFANGVAAVAGYGNPWPTVDGAGAAGGASTRPEADGRESASRAFRLTVRFPEGRTGISEPLVTTGKAGAADGIFVKYESANSVRIGFDHWGVGGPVSAPIAIDYGATHALDVMVGDGAWSQGGAGPLRVLLDGRTVLATTATFFPAGAGEVGLGKNLPGLSTSQPEFGGQILGVTPAR